MTDTQWTTSCTHLGRAMPPTSIRQPWRHCFAAWSWLASDSYESAESPVEIARQRFPGVAGRQCHTCRSAASETLYVAVARGAFACPGHALLPPPQHQSVNQSVDQSIDQSVSQSVTFCRYLNNQDYRKVNITAKNSKIAVFSWSRNKSTNDAKTTMSDSSLQFL